MSIVSYKKRVQISLPKGLYKRYKKMAIDRDITLSELILIALSGRLKLTPEEFFEDSLE